MTQKLTFTGHETFHCRHFWLKKGYDFQKASQKRAASTVDTAQATVEEAILQLGVGKNMVQAINFWMKAFSVRDTDNQLTELADRLLSDNGYDPYLEDTASLWLLQYHLVKQEVASIFALVFKEFRKTRIDGQFTVQQLLQYLLKVSQQTGTPVKESTLRNDIKVFLKSYYLGQSGQKDIEDNLNALLLELNLLQAVESKELKEGTYYQLNVGERADIPEAVFLYAILDQFPGEVSLSFDMIKEGVADAFACSDEGLEIKLQQIANLFTFATYKEDGGRKELQFKSSPSKWKILDAYYHH